MISQLWKVGWDRQQFYANTGTFSSDNIVREMLRGADKWSHVGHYFRVFFLVKKMKLDPRSHRAAEGFFEVTEFRSSFSLRFVKNIPQVERVERLAWNSVPNRSRLDLWRRREVTLVLRLLNVAGVQQSMRKHIHPPYSKKDSSDNRRTKCTRFYKISVTYVVRLNSI